jgi:alkylation response protein AidB-like acyl-CoA dehydrogenase
MRFARASNTTTGLLRRAFRRAAVIVETLCDRDSDLLCGLAKLDSEIYGFESLELMMLNSAQGSVSDVQASLLKTLATELHQKITAFALEACGPLSAATSFDGRSPHLRAPAFAARKYLATRAASIYSGTNETHRNLIARHL